MLYSCGVAEYLFRLLDACNEHLTAEDTSVPAAAAAAVQGRVSVAAMNKKGGQGTVKFIFPA